ncbi:hypothetical protein AB0I81_06625 [Nonomuraea sp. NPDC050404]|uniref:hypothetical protein n=1 Tax=Nonomuraea sp. NPDC050404 TaxID=3155783 RepID=UPI0033C451E5
MTDFRSGPWHDFRENDLTLAPGPYNCAQLHCHRGRIDMRMRFLGSTSEAGACPTLYETDRGTIVVQGLQVTDAEALADLRDVLDGEAAVEVPRELLTEIARRVLPEGSANAFPTSDGTPSATG